MSFVVTPAKNEYDHPHLRIGRIIGIVIIVFLVIILITSCFTSVPAGFTGVRLLIILWIVAFILKLLGLV